MREKFEGYIKKYFQMDKKVYKKLLDIGFYLFIIKKNIKTYVNNMGGNMVRPKAKEAKKQYTVMLKPSVVERIDKIADKVGVSRSQMMSNLIDSGLDDAEVFDKAGFLDVFRIGGKVLRTLKEKIKKGELELT